MIEIKNKKASFDYFIEDKYEAGISLHGTEVKSLRLGKCSIKEAFIRIKRLCAVKAQSRFEKVCDYFGVNAGLNA